MNPYLNAYLDPYRRYADFRGRTARHNYWVFTLINLLIGILDQLFLNMMRSSITNNVAPNPAVLALVSLITIYSVATLIPSCSALVRRLHDTGRSGWLALILLLPFIGPLLMLIWTVQDSEPGQNHWGPKPKLRGDLVC